MGVPMRRRDFIRLLGAAVAGWSSRVQAQQQAIPVVGYLGLGSERAARQYDEAYLSGFAALGYIEGKNIRLISRFADGDKDRLAPLTTELVSLGAKVIVTTGGAAIEAAHKAAPSVPIVAAMGPDPVMMGWAKSLAKPGGMITGLFANTQSFKKFELLKEVRPQATKFALFMNANNPATPYMRKYAVDGSHTIGIELEIIELKDLSEVAVAFDRLRALAVGGVAITSDPLFNSNPALFAELALKHKLPSVGDDRTYAKAGGLFARSINFHAMASRPARFVDQILKGVDPGDIAAELSDQDQLTVNLKTAKELGVTIPLPVITLATDLIE
jgi:putative tryptophan/tyrosine transport system substrate-binding protein